MSWKTAIENRMKKLGIRKSDLASRSGLSKSYITNLLNDDESKRKKSPTFESIQKIAAVLGVKGWTLWKEAEES